jgi:hypothetical protein
MLHERDRHTTAPAGSVKARAAGRIFTAFLVAGHPASQHTLTTADLRFKDGYLQNGAP